MAGFFVIDTDIFCDEGMMEGFLSLNWDKAVDESSCFSPKDVFENTSAAFHSFNGIPQSPWPNEEQPLLKANTENKSWSPCSLKRETVQGPGGEGMVLKIQLPVPFPKKSVLNVYEQKDYLFTINRIMKSFIQGVPAEPGDFKLIKETQIKLKDETQDFQRFAQTVMQNNPSVYSNLNPGVAKYVNDAWKTQLATIRQYPPCYKLIGNITLIPKENIITLEMNLDKTVLELGQIPFQIFPKLNTIIKVQRNHKIINKRYPSNTLENEHQVSNDGNAAKLAPKYGANIVISSNTLRSLAGNVGPLFRRAWDIPFTVKEMIVQGENKKVIFVDEPLPPAEMSAMEKNAFFNRFAVKCQFSTVMNRSRIFSYPGSGKKYGCPTRETHPNVLDVPEDIFETQNVDHDSIETFGVEKNACPQSESECNLDAWKKPNSEEEKVPAKIKAMEKDESTACDSDSSDLSLVIDTGSEYGQSPRKRSRTTEEKIGGQRKKLLNDTDSSETSVNNDSSSQNKKSKLSENNAKNPVKQVSKSTPESLLNVILQDQEKMMQSQRKQPPKNIPSQNSIVPKENPQEYTQPKKNENLTYRTWDLNVNEKCIRLLVRSSVDSVIVKSGEPLKTFLMTPKTEYQPWYGAEFTGPREGNEQWMDLHLRPECQIVRVRLDAYTGDLLFVETKDAACLEAENSFRYGTQNKPANCLQNIWAVLSSLCDLNLKPGKFLLRHGFHDGICVQVWESSEKESSSLDLHQIYAEIDATANAVRDASENWSALDPWAVLPFQRALYRPPLTFEPEEGLKKVVGKKGDGKKKKSKKKKVRPQPTTNS